MTTTHVGIGSRLLTFDVGSILYALPISEVLEVVESAAVTCVPALPRNFGGVMNWHGEALPLVAPRVLLEAATDADGEAVPPSEAAVETTLASEQVLVISDRSGELPRLGLPIDSVLGITDISVRIRLGKGSGVVAERRSIDGRVVSVLDRRRLVARAREAIEDMAA